MHHLACDSDALRELLSSQASSLRSLELDIVQDIAADRNPLEISLPLLDQLVVRSGHRTQESLYACLTSLLTTRLTLLRLLHLFTTRPFRDLKLKLPLLRSLAVGVTELSVPQFLIECASRLSDLKLFLYHAGAGASLERAVLPFVTDLVIERASNGPLVAELASRCTRLRHLSLIRVLEWRPLLRMRSVLVKLTLMYNLAQFYACMGACKQWPRLKKVGIHPI